MFAGFTLHKKYKNGTRGRKSYLGVRVGKAGISIPAFLIAKFPEDSVGVRFYANEKKNQILVAPTNKENSETETDIYYLNQKDFKDKKGIVTGAIMDKTMTRGRYYVVKEVKEGFIVESLINDPNEHTYYNG